MDEIPLSVLLGALALLIVLSAFFSGSETGLMTLNRYRLRHQASAGNRIAQLIQRMLQRPDRLIGVILLGNNFVNILAASLATIIATRIWGEAGIAIATGALTIIILIFGELTPKTLAALHPERVAFPAAVVLAPLLRVLYPLVWAINTVANWILRLVGVATEPGGDQRLSFEELRTIVTEAGALAHRGHERMLLNLLDLEAATVEDIMVPRTEIDGIDIDDDIDDIAEQLIATQYSWLPVHRQSIDQVFGMLQVRRALPLLYEDEFTRDDLARVIQEPYFIPESTPLVRQMLNFQREKRRIGLVVDEYGEIIGLVTLEDILEQVVGEFTTDPSALVKEAVRQPDGSYLVDASIPVRALNRLFGWEMPTAGPKTLNGLILEYMETIPAPDTSLRLFGYPLEIVQTSGTSVKTVLIQPGLPRVLPKSEESI